MSILLEVSIGEALDKLSILEIKKDKIKDERNKQVENEYLYLNQHLNSYIQQYKYYYDMLTNVNLQIWNLQDIIRDKDIINKENYYDLCDEILNLNDSRYLIKKKINEVCNSNFKEQKGYNFRILNIILSFDNNYINVDSLNGIIRYYSFFYDELNIYANDYNYNYVEETFDDDKFIRLLHLSQDTLDLIKNFKGDYICIEKDNLTKNITHSFFKNKKIFKNVEHPDENVKYILDNLNLNINVCNEYYYK